MGSLVVGTNSAQVQPQPNQLTGSFGKGTIYVQASATGTGTWSAIFNLAPVSPGGVVGSIKQFSVSNSAPMIDQDIQTGASAFIGWWTNFVGSVTYAIGSVDG